MSRRWRWPGLALLLLGLGLWWTSRGAPEVVSPGVRDGARAAREGGAPRFLGLLQTAPPASGDAVSRIRGIVKGPRGPVAGAAVLASMAVAGEALSEQSCQEGTARVADDPFIFECASPRQLAGLVAQRSGEAPVLARAKSAADGTFAVEGLEAGRYALWVESDEGTGLRLDVAAGEEGVELRLEAGTRVSGVVRDSEERPVEGALVTAVFMDHSRFFESVTDGAGRFHLGPLARGAYVLLTSKAGLRPEQETFKAYAPTLEREIVLARLRDISGRVLLGGVPVAGARVRTWTPREEETEHEVLSDEQGRFSLELEPDEVRYALIATKDGRGATTRADFTRDEEDSDPPELPAEVTLELSPMAEVRGAVRDDVGRPVPRAMISLYEMGPNGSHLLWSTRADAEGRYHLEPIPEGSFWLIVGAKGCSEVEGAPTAFPKGVSTLDFTLVRATRLEGVLVDAGGRPVVNEFMTLNTPEGGEGSMAFTGRDGRFFFDVARPGTYELWVEGKQSRRHRVQVAVPSHVRVIAERLPSVLGDVEDAAGTLMPHVEVGLWVETSERTGGVQLASTRTDAQGHFALTVPVPGRYRLVAEFTQDALTHVASRWVDLGEGETHVRLGFEAGRALSGVVVDRRGQPLEGVFLQVRSSLRGHPRQSTGADKGVWTGPDGHFTFPDVTGEPLQLMASKEDYVLACAEQRDAPPALELDPRARDVRVVLVHPAAVHGRLVDEAGAPLALVTVNGRTRYNAEGRFSWPIHCTGPLELELSARGLVSGAVTSRYEPVRHSLAVQEEVDQDLGIIRLRRPSGPE